MITIYLQVLLISILSYNKQHFLGYRYRYLLARSKDIFLYSIDITFMISIIIAIL